MTLKEIQIQVGGHVTSTIHSDHSTLLGGGFCTGRKEKTACGTQTAGCRGGWKGHDWFILFYFLPLFLWEFTSSLAALFQCGVCLKCNLGTIYDISKGARNKTHYYMCTVSGGSGCHSTAPQEQHCSSTDSGRVFFSLLKNWAVNYPWRKIQQKYGRNEGENFPQMCCNSLFIKYMVMFLVELKGFVFIFERTDLRAWRCTFGCKSCICILS